MTWILVAVGYLILVVLIGRWVRGMFYRQTVLFELLVHESEMSEFWSNRVAGLIQMRLDFGDGEALVWFDLDMAQSEPEMLELLNRGEKLLDQL